MTQGTRSKKKLSRRSPSARFSRTVGVATTIGRGRPCAGRRVSRSKDPRANGRHVIELRFEQDERRCAGCELADRCLASGSPRRTVRRLEDQSLMDQQKEKMQSEAGTASSRHRKMRIERRYGDSKKHRGGSELHGRGLTRATAETGLMVVAQNCLTLYLKVKREETKPTEAGRSPARAG